MNEEEIKNSIEDTQHFQKLAYQAGRSSVLDNIARFFNDFDKGLLTEGELFKCIKSLLLNEAHKNQ